MVFGLTDRMPLVGINPQYHYSSILVDQNGNVQARIIPASLDDIRALVRDEVRSVLREELQRAREEDVAREEYKQAKMVRRRR